MLMGTKFMFESTRLFFFGRFDLAPDIGMAALSHATSPALCTDPYLRCSLSCWEVKKQRSNAFSDLTIK